jgi:hypothetical protein
MNLQKLELGGGIVTSTSEGWRLALPASREYADAQLDDTAGIARNQLCWKPPVRLSLQARTSTSTPAGTFGFGFWNDPFNISLGMGGTVRRLPAMPQTAWFFYLSPPGDLPLAPASPGHGWKAATLRSARMPGWLVPLLAAGGAALLAIPPLRKPAFAVARRFYRAEEAALAADFSRWHEYEIEWQETAVLFRMDGKPVLRSSHPPPGPLGLVIWIDNQFAIASPERGFGFGVSALDQSQYLEVRALRVEALGSA